MPPSTEPPKNWLWANILGILGCLPVGVIGLIFAIQVSSKWQSGDYAGAEQSANVSKIMGIIGLILFVLSIIGVILYILLVVIAVSSSPTYSTY